MIMQREQKLTILLAGFIAGTVCSIRLSMAAASVFNVLALLIGFLLYRSNRGSFFLSNEAKGYLGALGIFILSTIPSVLFSNHPMEGFHFLADMLLWRSMIFVLLAGFLRRRDYLVNMLAVFLVAFGVDCLVAMGQVVLNVTRHGRGWGLGGDLLTIAGIMCMVLPIAVVILLDPRFEKKLKKAAVFSVIAVLAGLLANKSRGAWLTELFVVPVAVGRYLLHSLKYTVIFFLITGCFIGYMATNRIYVARFRSITNITTDHSNGDRIWLWRSSQKMFQDHLIAGVGLGQFREHYIANYKYKQETQNLMHSHNNFVQTAAECGMIGLAGFLYFVGYFLFTSFKNWKRDKNPYDILIFTTVLGFIVLFGQIEYTLDNSSGMRIFWFLLALLLQMKENDRDEER